MKYTFIKILFLSTSILFGQDLAKVSTDFEKYGLNETNIPEKWEDGMRTTGDKGTYEWWYFDAHLDDGSTIVITFYTKFMIAINKPLDPYVTVSIDKADGSTVKTELHCEPDDFNVSKDSCNIKMGNSYVVGNLKEYKIHIEDE